jgi:hypothetical protein
LPIVVFVFGLWFLLAFKFCIPPKVSLDLGLQAEFNAVPPNMDADFSVQVDMNMDGVLETRTSSQINADLVSEVGGAIADTSLLPQGTVESKLGQFANSPLIALNSNYSEVEGMPRDVTNDPAVGIDYTALLEYEERVTPEVSP